MKERVLGQTLPNEVYERLANQGVVAASVMLYVTSQRAEHVTQARSAFKSTSSGNTARSRYILSFAE